MDGAGPELPITKQKALGKIQTHKTLFVEISLADSSNVFLSCKRGKLLESLV